MWEPLRLTTLWASTTCYRDGFTFFNKNVWDVTPYSLVNGYQDFGGTNSLHHQSFSTLQMVTVSQIVRCRVPLPCRPENSYRRHVLRWCQNARSWWLTMIAGGVMTTKTAANYSSSREQSMDTATLSTLRSLKSALGKLTRRRASLGCLRHRSVKTSV
jgi:hypothetical protein